MLSPSSSGGSMSVHFRLTMDDLRASTESLGDTNYTTLSAEGAVFVRPSGEDAFLCRVVEIGIPEDARPRLRELSRVVDELALPGPAPTSGERKQATFVPASLGARLQGSGWIRGQRVQSLRVDLAVYRNDRWQILREAEYELDLGTRLESGAGAVGTLESEAFESVFASRLLNNQRARNWRVDPAQHVTQAQGALRDAAPPWLEDQLHYRIGIREDGICRVSYSWLQQNGVPVNEISPSWLRLWCGEEEVPLLLRGASDGSFDPGDYFLFVGRYKRGEFIPTDFYSPEQAYFLTWQHGPGLRYRDLQSPPQSGEEDQVAGLCELHFERNVIWNELENITTSPNELDHWFWRSLSAIGVPSSSAQTIYIPNPSQARPDTSALDEASIYLRGNSSEGAAGPDHHVIAWLNDRFLADLSGTSQEEMASGWVGLYPGSLEVGYNTLRMDLPMDHGESSDLCYLDWLKLRYWRELLLTERNPQFEVGAEGLEGENLAIAGIEGDLPILLTDDGHRLIGWEISVDAERDRVFRFQLPLGAGGLHVCELSGVLEPERLVIRENEFLRSVSNQADMIVLAPSEYHDALTDLVAYHGQSMNARLIDIEAIYNEFNHGRMHVDAIKNFLTHAFHQWQAPLPSYLLLVGKTSTANQQDIGRDVIYTTQIPSDWIDTRPYGATCSDETITYIVGGDDDRYQDIMVGRLSVSNLEQLEAYLQKHREYRELQYAGPWMETQFHVADSDGEYVFEIGNNAVITHLVPEELPVKVLHVRTTSEYNGGALDFLDIMNDGCSVMNYNGHGAVGVLSSRSVFRATDLRYLTNRGKYPIGYAWSCLVGYIDSPDTSSLAELLVRKPQAGAIAYYGAAAKAYINLDTPYLNCYFSQHHSEEEYTLGQIIMHTEAVMDGIDTGNNITHMYNLLGDPALYPAHPRKHLIPDESVLVAADGESQSVVIHTDPPGLSGQLSVAFHENPHAPVNFEAALSTTTLSFSDGDSVPLTMPVLGEGKRCVIRFALAMNQDRATGSLPVFLNTDYAGIGTHEPSVVAQGSEVEFYFQSETDLDSVSLVSPTFISGVISNQLTLYGRDLAFLPNDWDYLTCYRSNMDYLGNGRFVMSVDSLPSSYRSVYSVSPHVASTEGGSYSSVSVNLSGFLYGFIAYHEGGATYIGGSLIEVLRQEGLTSVDTTFAVSGYGDTQELEWRWVLGSQVPVDQVVRSLRVSYSDDPDSLDLQSLLADTVSAEAGERVFQTQVNMQAGNARLYLDLGPVLHEGQRVSTLDALSLSDEFLLLTPSSGSGGMLTLLQDDRWQLEIDASALPQAVLLNPAADTRNPNLLREESTGQPGLGLLESGAVQNLQMLDLQPRNPELLESFADSLSGVIQCSLPLGTSYQFSDEVLGDTLRHGLARWNAERGLWVVLHSETRVDSTNEIRTILATPRLNAGPLWPVMIRDTDGPLVEYAVDGQWFSAGDLVPQSPSFRILVEDADGIDLGEGGPGPRVYLDNVLQADESLLIGEGTTSLELVWNPGVLEANEEHTLRIEVDDALGNTSSTELPFQVSGDMQLSFFANHPNPFADQTVFAWELTGLPNDIEMTIYTSSGRCIRSISVSIPRMGYDEYTWDGRDDKGREVANGVYFLRFSASGSAGSVEEVFKLARLQ